jgi:hypothetical protein
MRGRRAKQICSSSKLPYSCLPTATEYSCYSLYCVNIHCRASFFSLIGAVPSCHLAASIWFRLRFRIQTIFGTVFQQSQNLYKILPFQCQNQQYFQSWSLIFNLTSSIVFYVGSRSNSGSGIGTVIHSGSGSAKAKRQFLWFRFPNTVFYSNISFDKYYHLDPLVLKYKF